MRLSWGNCMAGAGLERLETTGGVGNYPEMTSEGRTDVGRACLRINL